MQRQKTNNDKFNRVATLTWAMPKLVSMARIALGKANIHADREKHLKEVKYALPGDSKVASSS